MWSDLEMKCLQNYFDQRVSGEKIVHENLDHAPQMINGRSLRGVQNLRMRAVEVNHTIRPSWHGPDFTCNFPKNVLRPIETDQSQI